ncbi:hypothetical protein DER44DRAFT_786851 [Fusarium oxysporum]|nr:hypothetical protein DER44DRAFT_786851 [Fusarium oxysporum]
MGCWVIWCLASCNILRMMFGFQGLSLYTDCIACPGLSRIVLIQWCLTVYERATRCIEGWYSFSLFDEFMWQISLEHLLGS